MMEGPIRHSGSRCRGTRAIASPSQRLYGRAPKSMEQKSVQMYSTIHVPGLEAQLELLGGCTLVPAQCWGPC